MLIWLFLVSIRLAFLSIYQTDTGGKLGGTFWYYKCAGTPFPPQNMNV